jgi:hypothetical protein
MSRPAHCVGRPGLFTAEQVKAWRDEYARRKALREELAKLRTMDDMAREAGVQTNAVRLMLCGTTYKWVR